MTSAAPPGGSLRRQGAAARSVALGVACLAAFAGAVPAEPARATPRSVLVIEPDRANLPIYLVAKEALRATLRGAPGLDADMFLESLDLSRFDREGYWDELEGWLATKYRGRRVDAVVALGPVSYRAVARWRERLWPGVPVVFGGVDRQTLDAVGRLSDSTGQLIEFGHLDTVRAALELLPATRHLAIVGGPPNLDAYARYFGAQIAAEFGARLDVIDLSGLPMAEILDRASRLPPNSVIVMTSLNADGAGRAFTGQEAAALLAARANAPTFAFIRTHLGSGVVGGVLLDSAIVGREVGTLVIRILQGEPAGSIAVAASDVNVIAFDWRLLERWGLPERRLPAGSVIEFRPKTAWQEYRTPILAVAGLVVLQAGLIGALLFERRRRREANRELHRLSGRLLTAQEDERRRVARELHDDISQRLSLLAIELDAATLEADAGLGLDAGEAAAKVHALAVDVHAIAYDLHPPRLEALGLPATLRAFCDEVGKRQAARIECRIDEPATKVSADLALALFRVAQEAVQNAVRHSGAGRIGVGLASAGSELVLTVTDDGKGLAAALGSPAAGLGVASMRERMRYVGGRLDIDDLPGQGFTVRASVPLSPPRGIR